jgi:hypothetical protein
MTTFSQMVDELVAECARPDQYANIASYISQTIRELHVQRAGGSSDGMPILYGENLVEVEIEADTEERFLWAIPNPARFQYMESVWFASIGDYARPRTPSSALAFSEEINGNAYYYRTGSQFAFAGYGGVYGLIKLAYHEFPRRLIYYKKADRPAVWNPETEDYTYLPSYDTSIDQRNLALTLTTNWMLDRYEDVLKEGARAKLYKRLGDELKMKASYSLFESFKPQLAGEVRTLSPQYRR